MRSAPTPLVTSPDEGATATSPRGRSLPVFSHLLGTVSPDEFRSRHYGQQLLHVPGDAEKFRGLFGWGALNDLLNYLPFPEAANGLELVLDGTFNAVPESPVEVWRRCRAGETLLVKRLETQSPPVARFIRALASELGEKVSCNLYVSQTSVPGLGPHYDDHDVFVLQLEGTKSWSLGKATCPWPTTALRERRGVAGPPPPLDRELTLERGDVLYVPRGCWHQVLARDEESMHLTVGLYSRMASDFLAWLNERLQEHPFFRRSAPLVFRGEDGLEDGAPAPLADWIDEIGARMTALCQRSEIADEYHRSCVAVDQRDEPIRFPISPGAGRPLTDETELSRPPWQRATLAPAEGGRHLRVGGLSLIVAEELVEVARRLFSRERLTLGELLAGQPPSRRDPVVALVRQLEGEGLLRLG